ncbi:MAG: two pore domain potassium channel family protein [FCB group bacterium]|nr:two pore domain potassium channel family protein [FCB group bacterium]MBL7029380.1 two pore domain potassium channel family protein [Candidatus Neomarinimicrobiota bacterium]MBL7123063.1 two pore domain potassium channel family protein [Candidatus Neomarinimicrobiota bacterium]
MMIIWGPLVYLILFIIIILYVRKPSKDVPVTINGMIPSLPGAKDKEQSGSTVLIFYSDEDPKNTDHHIFLGYADNKGRVTASVPKSNVGREVTLRIRHAAYLPQEITMKISMFGIFYTAKMEPDGVYDGTIRGAPPENLVEHYREALTEADRIRFQASNIAKILGRTLAEIPFLFWLIAYVAIIVSNAADYYKNSMCFEGTIESVTQSIYFSVVTITTLGYGDIYPKHDLLRIACSFEALMGVLILGLFLNSLFYERNK